MSMRRGAGLRLWPKAPARITFKFDELQALLQKGLYGFSFRGEIWSYAELLSGASSSTMRLASTCIPLIIAGKQAQINIVSSSLAGGKANRDGIRLSREGLSAVRSDHDPDCSQLPLKLLLLVHTSTACVEVVRRVPTFARYLAPSLYPRCAVPFAGPSKSAPNIIPSPTKSTFTPQASH
jgi:hypothetical protein